MIRADLADAQQRAFATPTCSYDIPVGVQEEELYKDAEYWVDTRHMSADQISALAQPKLAANGFVLLRGVLDSAAVSRLRKHIVGKYGHQGNLKVEEWYDYPLDLGDDIVRESLFASVKRLLITSTAQPHVPPCTRASSVFRTLC